MIEPSKLLGEAKRVDLGGKVTGLLYQQGPQPWGTAIDYNHFIHFANEEFPVVGDDEEAAMAPAVSDDTYVFGITGAAPYVLYFPSRGEGENFLANWSVPIPGATPARYDAAAFSRTTPNPWGLSKPAHLVELEVNGGRGGTGLHFVATNVKILDGTGAIAPVGDTLLALRKRFDRAVRELGPRITAAMRGPRRRHPEIDDHHDPLSRETVAVLPAWDARTSTLDVVFIYARTRGATVASRAPSAPPPFLFARPLEREPEPQYRGYGAAMAVRYRANGRGTVTDELVYLPVGFSQNTGDKDDWSDTIPYPAW